MKDVAEAVLIAAVIISSSVHHLPPGGNAGAIASSHYEKVNKHSAPPRYEELSYAQYVKRYHPPPPTSARS